MKKLIVIFLALAMVLAIASCGAGNNSDVDPEKDPVSGGEGDPDNNQQSGGEKEPADGDAAGDDADAAGDDGDAADEDGDGEGDVPSPPSGGIVPGFPAINVPSGSGDEDIPVADAGDLVDTLDALCKDVIAGSYTETLRSSGLFSSYFGGKVQYTEGMRVATNLLEMAPPAHVILLIEVPEGENAEEYAKNLEANANPRWMVCATASSVQYAVKGDLVLFVMSSEENANAIIAAFNG